MDYMAQSHVKRHSAELWANANQDECKSRRMQIKTNANRMIPLIVHLYTSILKYRL
jgi:hypothetical protein